jgi:hypothetical protein
MRDRPVLREFGVDEIASRPFDHQHQDALVFREFASDFRAISDQSLRIRREPGAR